MAIVAQESLQSLCERDETAWLELTAKLVAQGCFAEVNREQLSEYLTDMARHDRREVFSRLTVLMTHFLKWAEQPNLRGILEGNDSRAAPRARSVTGKRDTTELRPGDP